MQNKIYTIGYEGSTIDDFVRTLQVAGVERLIDIRELPISRRKGFAKRALSEHLEAAGIEYVHVKALGDPKEGRNAARRGDYATFKEVFSNHLETPVAKDALVDAVDMAHEKVSCLMCYERDHKTCHRSMVASEIVLRSKVEIKHIGVREGISK
jgi:uncharacterized protein (DUF488 family)